MPAHGTPRTRARPPGAASRGSAARRSRSPSAREIVSKSLLLIRQVDETIQLAIKAVDDGCDLRAMRSFKTMMEQSRVCLSLAYENLSDAFNSRSPDTLTQERDALREVVSDQVALLRRHCGLLEDLHGTGETMRVVDARGPLEPIVSKLEAALTQRGEGGHG